MMKQLKYAALLAALAFGAQWTMAEDTDRSADDPSQADQQADDSGQAGKAGQADDNQDNQDPAAADLSADPSTDSATGDAASPDDAAQPAAGRDAASDAASDDASAAQPAAGRNAAGKPGQAGKAAQPRRAGAKVGAQEHGNKDEMFAKHAASGGMLEVAAAQLAVERVQNDELKQYAQRIIDDHTKANDQLKQIAESAGIQLDQQMMPVHQAKLDALSQKQGEDFEKCYLYGDLAHHVHDVLSFRDASQDLQNQQLKDFATQTLPTLKEHLAQAAQLANWDEATTAGATERGSGTRDRSGKTPAPGGNQQRPGARPGQPGDAGDTGGGDDSSHVRPDPAPDKGADGASSDQPDAGQK